MTMTFLPSRKPESLDSKSHQFGNREGKSRVVRLRTRSTPNDYQLSVWDPWSGTSFFIIALHTLFLVPWLALPGGFKIGLVVLLITIGLFSTGRRRIIVKADATWGDTLAFGIRLKRKNLGLHPIVEVGGWDWTEVSAYPADASPLSDDQRFVLVEWTDGNAESARNNVATGSILVQEIRMEIGRIQGQRPADEPTSG